MSVQITEAQIILANLCERIERGADGKYRLPGIVTVTELDVLKFFSSWSPGHAQSPAPLVNKPRAPTSQEAYVEPVAEGDLSATSGTPGAVTENVALDVSSLNLTAADQRYRVCMDFGTAMSKATFVYDNEDEDAEEIRVLMLGIPGDQEQVDETMLVSSVFIDDDGLLWFGQHAIERAQAAPDGRARMDNIKRALSEGNLGEPVDPAHNPSQYGLTYEDVVLAYLAFFTWTINSALLSDVSEPKVARNFKRRFAMPCFPRASAQIVKDKLKVLLGEAQVLADTFKDDIHEGLELGRFLSALRQLRSEPRTYPFIEESVTEPLGVAGSILSWKASNNSLVLVVDIGAGTSDFSLYRLRVAINEDGTLNKAKTNAGEVEGTARGITEAGNHLDKILMAFILKQAGVDATHANYVNITHALERDIRNYKEALFSSGSVYVVLYTNDAIEVSLDEFMALDAITAFESSLRKTVTDILESADSTWIEWVRAHPNRRLTIVLAGGGASLPMVRRLAQGTVTAHGMTIPVAAAKSFPDWLRDDYPDLEASYPRIAASLGGARKNTIQSMGVLKTTGGGVGEFILERF
jgi:molecular chaperone HscA